MTLVSHSPTDTSDPRPGVRGGCWVRGRRPLRFRGLPGFIPAPKPPGQPVPDVEPALVKDNASGAVLCALRATVQDYGKQAVKTASGQGLDPVARVDFGSARHGPPAGRRW